MLVFVGRRLVQTVFVLFLVTFVTFFLIQVMPGDPVKIMLGLQASEEQIQALRKELRLDSPLISQYGYWLSDLLRGRFGNSIIYKVNVTDLILTRLPVTVYLGGLGFLLTGLIGIPAGIYCAVKRNSKLDNLITLLANTAVSVPVFWLGILGIYLFGIKLSLLPIQGFTSPFDDFWLSLRKIIMPVFCLTVVPLAAIVRQTRSATLEIIRLDYIRTARSKGLQEKVIIFRHIVKNAIIPVLTLLGIYVRDVFGGSVLIETVFNIPGMGRLIARSVFDRDFIVVQACVIIIAAVVAIANLIVDISYRWIDPRIKYE